MLAMEDAVPVAVRDGEDGITLNFIYRQGHGARVLRCIYEFHQRWLIPTMLKCRDESFSSCVIY